MSQHRLIDRGRLIVGLWPDQRWWSWGVLHGAIATWWDLGPFYIGWRHPCSR